MQLVYASASPFVRKVHALLIETGQLDQVELVAVKTAPTAVADEARAANPSGKIPALIRSDGPAIYDSRVITRYLDARANAGLYPDTRIWEVLTLEATADAIMDAAVLVTWAVTGHLSVAHLVFTGIACVLAIWRHKSNIQRLIRGTES